MKIKNIYQFFDIEMNMWTDPVVFRNDVEAKKFLNYQLKHDTFNGCPVEMYRVGILNLDLKNAPIELLVPERIFSEDTVDDEGEVSLVDAT